MIEIPNLAELDITREQWIEVCQLAYFKEVENEKLLNVQKVAAQQHRWDVVYSLSLMANLETSVLIDQNDMISIDWGDPGMVRLDPPIGFMAPFKLWVHTHPGFDAYWSGTDRLSLTNAGPMIETALVLGSTGVKRSLNMALLGLIGEPLGEEGSLRNWSDEDSTPWDAWYESMLPKEMLEEIL